MYENCLYPGVWFFFQADFQNFSPDFGKKSRVTFDSDLIAGSHCSFLSYPFMQESQTGLGGRAVSESSYRQTRILVAQGCKR